MQNQWGGCLRGPTASPQTAHPDHLSTDAAWRVEQMKQQMCNTWPKIQMEGPCLNVFGVFPLELIPWQWESTSGPFWLSFHPLIRLLPLSCPDSSDCLTQNLPQQLAAPSKWDPMHRTKKPCFVLWTNYMSSHVFMGTLFSSDTYLILTWDNLIYPITLFKGICLQRILIKLDSAVWTATTDGDVNDDKSCSLFTKHQFDEKSTKEKKPNKKQTNKKKHHEASTELTAAGRKQ